MSCNYDITAVRFLVTAFCSSSLQSVNWQLSICISNAFINFWSTGIITPNTAASRWWPKTCCSRTIFHPKSALENKMMKLEAISNYLPFSTSLPLTSLSSYLTASALFSLPLSLTLSLLALLPVLSWRQPATASVFCVKGDIKADLKTFRSDEDIRLPLSALVALWTAGEWRSNTGIALGSSGSWHAQRLVCWGQRMRLTRDQTNA